MKKLLLTLCLFALSAFADEEGNRLKGVLEQQLASGNDPKVLEAVTKLQTTSKEFDATDQKLAEMKDETVSRLWREIKDELKKANSLLLDHLKKNGNSEATAYRMVAEDYATQIGRLARQEGNVDDLKRVLKQLSERVGFFESKLDKAKPTKPAKQK